MGDDPGAIAEMLKVSAGYVSKLAAKSIEAGWCKKEGRGYMKRGFESCHEGDAVFGAMLPIRGSQCVNLAGFRNDEPDERGWIERAREQDMSDIVLPAEACL